MQDIINRLREKKADEGFTLIELLVVVVIIGVLVAIAIPVYLNYREGAADKSAQSDVRGAISAVEQFYSNNSNKYPDTATATGTAITLTIAGGTGIANGTITVSDNTQLGYNHAASAPSYTICGHNSQGNTDKWYKYDSALGGSVKGFTSTTATVASC